MSARKQVGAGRATRRRLGRGLESLVSDPVRKDVSRSGSEQPTGTPVAAGPAPAPSERGEPAIRMLPVSSVHSNPRQPRQRFREATLESLAASIQRDGLMQPVVVRPRKEGGYEIVAGERRWRAIQRLDLAFIPAVVRTLDGRAAARLSLVENLQREDLNAIERAEAFRRLTDEFDLTHQEIAQQVGLDRTSITNHLRLLDLDEFTTDALRSGALSMGHGRALLAITNLDLRRRRAHDAARAGWSVRDLERRIRADRTAPAAGSHPSPPRDAQTRDLERRLSEHLGTRVEIRPGRTKGTGQLVISFFSLDEFEGLARRIGFRSD